MKSIEQLRKFANQYAPTRRGYGTRETLLDIADQIEHEANGILDGFLWDKVCQFEIFMTSERWDELDIYEDDGLEAVGAFVKFLLDDTIDIEKVVVDD